MSVRRWTPIQRDTNRTPQIGSRYRFTQINAVAERIDHWLIHRPIQPSRRRQVREHAHFSTIHCRALFPA
jgi:hypothetical protein